MTKRNFRTNPEQMRRAHSAREVNKHPQVKTNAMLAGRVNRLKQELPLEVVSVFKDCTYDERSNYIHELLDKGWTQASIGRACGLSRESIRQVAKATKHTAVTNYPLPEPPLYPQPRVVTYTLPPKEMLDRLLELQPYAQKVRSSSIKYRSEAEEYSYLLNEATTKHGVTVYRLGKLLGITPSAIQFRLVRYGYRSSEGQSRSYQQIIEGNKAKLVGING